MTLEILAVPSVTGSSAESELQNRGAPYGSDLRLYSAAGVPTLR